MGIHGKRVQLADDSFIEGAVPLATIESSSSMLGRPGTSLFFGHDFQDNKSHRDVLEEWLEVLPPDANVLTIQNSPKVTKYRIIETQR